MLFFNSCEGDDSILNEKTITYEVMCVRSGELLESGDFLGDYFYSHHTWTEPIYYLESYDNEYCEDYAHVKFPSLYNFRNIQDLLGCYSSLHVSEGEYTCDKNEEITDSIFRLEFYKEKCLVKIHTTKCLLNKGQKLERKQYTCLFNEGSYSIDQLHSFRVTENEAVIVSSGMPSYHIPLMNYRGVIDGKCNYTNSLEKAVDINMVLEYSIDGNYALLMRDDGKLWGKFCLKNNILVFS